MGGSRVADLQMAIKGDGISDTEMSISVWS